MITVHIQNIEKPLTSPLQVRYCESFLCRLRGLMFLTRIEPNRGLLLVQARDSRLDSAIHMLFVFTDLAVSWINSDLVIVDTVLARAWRPVYVPRAAARYVLEIHPNRLQDFHIGDHVELING